MQVTLQIAVTDPNVLSSGEVTFPNACATNGVLTDSQYLSGFNKKIFHDISQIINKVPSAIFVRKIK